MRIFINKLINLCVIPFRMACILVVLNSCSLLHKTSDMDKVGFFTEETKPDDYQLRYPTHPSSVMSVNDRDDGGSGESWAKVKAEMKIREDAVYNKYNGVIIGKMTQYSVVSGSAVEGFRTVTVYNLSYTPIIYDQEKYQAPMTDYQIRK